MGLVERGVLPKICETGLRTRKMDSKDLEKWCHSHEIFSKTVACCTLK